MPRTYFVDKSPEEMEEDIRVKEQQIEKQIVIVRQKKFILQATKYKIAVEKNTTGETRDCAKISCVYEGVTSWLGGLATTKENCKFLDRCGIMHALGDAFSRCILSVIILFLDAQRLTC